MDLKYSKIPYSVRRNEAVHTTYAQAECGPVTFKTVCDSAAMRLGMDPHMVDAVVTVVLERAIDYLRIGQRVNIANMLSLYPQVHTSVKDKQDENGEWIPASADDIKPKKEDAEIYCEVHKRVNKDYRDHVHFERVKPNIKRPNQKKKKQ